LTRLQTQARAEGIKVVFVQRQTPSRSAEAVARAIGGRVEVLDDLAPDVPDALLHTARTLAESYR
jgi:zinc transport system substrate-binding protein